MQFVNQMHVTTNRHLQSISRFFILFFVFVYSIYIDHSDQTNKTIIFQLHVYFVENQRIIFQCQPKPQNSLGCPDGMTIDRDGKLWIACFFGGRVIQLDPDTGTNFDRIYLLKKFKTYINTYDLSAQKFITFKRQIFNCSLNK